MVQLESRFTKAVVCKQIEVRKGLTSKWEWRYPRCPGWPAKETPLPARPPPQTKPWWRSARSQRPHPHTPHFLTGTSITSISLTLVACQTWNHHTSITRAPAASRDGPRSLPTSRSPDHAPIPLHTKYSHWKMATLATHDQLNTQVHHRIL